jgi:hypothetical protein
MMPVEREFVSGFRSLRHFTGLCRIDTQRCAFFFDMYYFEDHVARAASQAGMRFMWADSPKYPSPMRLLRRIFRSSQAVHPELKDRDLIVPVHLRLIPAHRKSCARAGLAVEFDVPLHTHLLRLH